MSPLPRHPPALTACLHSLAEKQGKATVAHAIEISRCCGEIAEELGWEQIKRERTREAGLLFALRRSLEGDDSTHALQELELLSGVLDEEQQQWVKFGDERWDGSGPEGLKGTQIPDGARVIALAINWIALLTRDHGTGDVAIAICWRDAGSAYWPDAVRALTRVRARA